MDVRMAIEIDTCAYMKIHIVHDISDRMTSFFLNKSYGKDIEHIHIECICIKTLPGYEDWFKARRPRLRKESTVQLLDGNKKVIYNSFSFDFKIDHDEYEYFVNSTDSESQHFIEEKIIKSLSNFDYLKNKKVDFDIELFTRDFTAAMKSSYR
jgi:hypothetical protein